MEYRSLGRSGVMVSPLCLGAMNFGGPTNEEDSFTILNRAQEAGVNFIDTANVYIRSLSPATMVTSAGQPATSSGTHPILLLPPRGDGLLFGAAPLFRRRPAKDKP